MGEEVQLTNRIYGVSRPERPKGVRVQRGATERKQVEKFFYPCFKVKPPSTTSISPVTESAVARYRKASAISST